MLTQTKPAVRATRLLLCAAVMGLLGGCTFAQRAHVAWLDPAYEPGRAGHAPFTPLETQRLLSQPLKPDIEVFQPGHKPDRPFREIALFSVDGNGDEEPDAIQAFVDLARHAHADALIVDASSPKDVGQHDSAGQERAFLTPNQRYVFRATAIIWTNSPAQVP